MQHRKILLPMYVLIALVAMLVLNYLFAVVQFQIIPTPWNLLGIFPVALGVALNVIADDLFHKANTTVKPSEESVVLVTDGPFHVSRNPMYLGFVLILIGVAMLLGSLTPWFVIPVFAVLIDREFIGMEEQMLKTKFGVTWQEYAKRTRRWL